MCKEYACPCFFPDPYHHFALLFAFSFTFLCLAQAHVFLRTSISIYTHTYMHTSSWQGVTGSFGLLAQHAAALFHCCCSLPVGLNISRGLSSEPTVLIKRKAWIRKIPVLRCQRFSLDHKGQKAKSLCSPNNVLKGKGEELPIDIQALLQ